MKLKKIKKDMAYINSPRGFFCYCNNLTVTNMLCQVKHILLNKALDLGIERERACFHIDFNVVDTNPHYDYLLSSY